MHVPVPQRREGLQIRGCSRGPGPCKPAYIRADSPGCSEDAYFRTPEMQVLAEIPIRPSFILTGAFPDVIRGANDRFHTTEQRDGCLDLVFH